MAIKKTHLALASISLAALGLACFAHHNLNDDPLHRRFLDQEAIKLGFEEKYFYHDGRTLHYIEGPDQGPTLVLLHGQELSLVDYAPVLGKLSQDFHVFAVDYYGHGQSSKNPDLYQAQVISGDLARWINTCIGQAVILAGHATGALLAAHLASHFPELVRLLVLEDGPFFSTEKGRAEQTMAWRRFEIMDHYLKKQPEKPYTLYALERDYRQTLFNNPDGKDNWSLLVLEPARRQLAKRPHRLPKVWYYPPAFELNKIFAQTANLQDGSGDYDLRFGQSFYNFSWFDGFDQEQGLESISCPTLVLQTAPHEESAPSYYDDHGVLLSAMDSQDGQRVLSCLDQGNYIGGFDAENNIHAELPKQYIRVLHDFIRQQFSL